MQYGSLNDRPAAPAGLALGLRSQSQRPVLLPRKCLSPLKPEFGPSMTETLTVLSTSSAGVAALTTPGALHAPLLTLPPASPAECFKQQMWFFSTTGEPSYPEGSRKPSDSQEEKI